ncbi:MAG TPA: DUF2802 domain-containing protein [Steroidobacteraceae bacterium]|nr:DUF2802 domain-containing protein [Steroidobacteraceae bacterium]
MMIDTAWLVAALSGGAFVVAALCGMTLAGRARRRGERFEALEAEIAALRAEVKAASGIGSRVGERVRRLEQVGAQLSDRLGQLEVRGDGRPYDHAIAMVRHGADAERLVTHFGLSRGEADLVSLVHGQRKAG